MMSDLDRIVDECVDRIRGGEGVDACLASYPEHSGELRPLLEAVLQTSSAYAFAPSATAKERNRRRFDAALGELRAKREARQSLFSQFFGRTRMWAPVALAVVVAVIGYFGLKPMLFPDEGQTQIGSEEELPVSPITVQPSSDGNFVFLISDEVNAIDDFASLDVSISTIGLLPSGGAGWIEFEPEVREVDLTLLPGDETQEIWRGDVPESQYSRVSIRVDGVRGILKETGEEVEVKLPSGRLQISIPFEVSTDVVTSFTFDVTVVAAGNEKSGVKYILKPVINESGPDVEARPSKGKGKDLQQGP
jgi:hypothetical protein